MRSQPRLNASACGLSLALLVVVGSASAAPEAERPRSGGEIRLEEAKRAVAEGRIRYFPLKAEKPRVSGRATLDCLVEEGGWLTDCRVATEEPVGYDFGATAMAMAPLFKADPAAAGSRVQAPINFKPPE